MDNLRNFFQIPLVKFGVHVLLIIGLFVNVYNLYNGYKMSNKIESEKQVLDSLTKQNNDSRTQKDYFNSDLYRERYAKESNYKNKGEQIIDTSDIEITFNQTTNYIPTSSTRNENNIDRWIRCLFGYNTPTNVDSTKYLDSICRW